MKEKKSIYILKIVCILFVIIMHLISKAMINYPISSFTFKFLVGIDIILKTSVPIFVLISGNLNLEKNHTIKELILKILKYYLFFIIFNSIYKLFDALFVLNIKLDFSLLKQILVDSLLLKSIYQMWYFHIIFITYISIPIFKYFIDKKSKVIDFIILGILVFLFQILPWIVPVFYKNYTYLLVFLTYFYLGYILNKYRFKYDRFIYFILFLISYIFTYKKTIILDHDYYYFNFTFFNISFISIFIYNLFLRFEEKIKDGKIFNFIKKLSKYTFSVFLIHGLIIGFLSKFNIINIYYYNNYFYILIYLILVYSMSIISVAVIKYVVKNL